MLSSFTRESCPKKEENILWTLWEFKTCWRYLNSLPKLEIVLKIELKRNTWLRLVFPPSRLSCSCLVLRALQQNRVKSSLLYFFNKTSILNISNNSICLDHELCTNSLTPVSLQHKCKCFAFSVKRRQARGERLARVRCEGRSAKKYYYHYHFLVVLVAVAVAVMAKIVSTMQFAAHAKRNTLYGRSYGGKSKFFRLDGLLLFPIIMGLRCARFVRWKFRCIHLARGDYSRALNFKMAASLFDNVTKKW